MKTHYTNTKNPVDFPKTEYVTIRRDVLRRCLINMVGGRDCISNTLPHSVEWFNLNISIEEIANALFYSDAQQGDKDE